MWAIIWAVGVGAPTQKTPLIDIQIMHPYYDYDTRFNGITRRVVATLTIRGTHQRNSSNRPPVLHCTTTGASSWCAYNRVIRVGFCSRRVGSNTDPGLKDLIQYSRGGQKTAGECVSSHTTVKLMNCVLPLSHATGRDNERSYNHFGSSISPRSTFDTIEGHVPH